MMTLKELKEKLKAVDEITLMELLEVTSEDIVHRFSDYIENNYDDLAGEFDDTTPWD
jgi:hypothetical protein